jgi:GNAT superfamily N-acetyltransferase
MDPADRLERSQWDFFWRPEDATVHERPELLYLACPRDRPHLNAVTRTDPSHPKLDDLVTEVTEAHASVRSRWSVPSRIACEPLHRALERGGYVVESEHDARAIAVESFDPRPVASCEVLQVTTLEQLRDLAAVMHEAFELDRNLTDEELEENLRQCNDPNGRVRRFVAYENGRPVSCGGINAFDALAIGYLWAGCTVPDARGQGLYSAVLRERVAWAATRGLKWVGVYALTTTASPIVARQGFESHGSMSFWQREPIA